VRAAALEREHRLHVLALEQHAVAQSRGEIRRDLERSLDRDVVHARREYPLKIVVFHDFGYPPMGGPEKCSFRRKGATLHEAGFSRVECAAGGGPWRNAPRRRPGRRSGNAAICRTATGSGRIAWGRSSSARRRTGTGSTAGAPATTPARPGPWRKP